MIVLFASLLALSVFLIFAAIAGTFRESNRMDTLVKQYAERKMLEELELSQPFTTRVIEPLIREIARTLGRFTPQYFNESTRRRLEVAGNPYNWTVVEFLGLRMLTALLSALFFAFLFGALGVNPGWVILLVAAGLGLGFYLPLFWIGLRARSRQQEIQRTLPDALDLLTICVEAGLGFDAASAKLAEKWDNAISRAFGRALIEMRLGKARQAALRDMANRTGVGDVVSFVGAMLQADQLGTPIAQVLRIQSEQMRVLRRQRAQEAANQTPVKIVFPLVLFIFPSLFVVILGPAVIRLIVQGLFK